MEMAGSIVKGDLKLLNGAVDGTQVLVTSPTAMGNPRYIVCFVPNVVQAICI